MRGLLIGMNRKEMLEYLCEEVRVGCANAGAEFRHGGDGLERCNSLCWRLCGTEGPSGDL